MEQPRQTSTTLLLSSFSPSPEQRRSCCDGERIQRHLIVPHCTPSHHAEPPHHPSEPHCTLMNPTGPHQILLCPSAPRCALLNPSACPFAPPKPLYTPLNPLLIPALRVSSCQPRSTCGFSPCKKPSCRSNPPRWWVLGCPAAPMGAQGEGGVQWGTLGLLVSRYSARGCCWIPCSTSTLSPAGPLPQHPTGGTQASGPRHPTAPRGAAAVASLGAPQ